MKLYELYMALEYGDGYFQFKKTSDYDIASDYVFHKIDHITKLTFFPDPEYPELVNAIGKSDILRKFGKMDLFSSRLVSILENYDDFEFINVEIVDENNVFLSDSYFLPRMTKYIPCIDEASSSITDNPFTESITIIQKMIPNNTLAFFNENDDFLYTEKFIDLIKAHKLDIDFTMKKYKFIE